MTSHLVTGAYLDAGQAKGLYHYLYLILDIFSRKIVGWGIYEDESAQKNAAKLIRRTHLRESVRDNPLKGLQP
jgi:putative transposase